MDGENNSQLCIRRPGERKAERKSKHQLRGYGQTSQDDGQATKTTMRSVVPEEGSPAEETMGVPA